MSVAPIAAMKEEKKRPVVRTGVGYSSAVNKSRVIPANELPITPIKYKTNTAGLLLSAKNKEFISRFKYPLLTNRYFILHKT